MSCKKLLVLALVAVLLGCGALLASTNSALAAATWHVGPTGDYTTIQAAIDNVLTLPGDTIEVEAGTYDLTSRIEVTKAVSIVGDVTTPANVVVNAPTAGGTQHGQNSAFMILSSDVAIQGFLIQGALHTGTAQNAGIYVDDPRLLANPGLSNITITNNELTNNGFGIVPQNVKNSTISNNKVYSSKKVAGKESESGVGIVVYGRTEDANHTFNLTIEDNQVYTNETEGIRIDVVSDVGATPWVNDLDITISNNIVYNNGSTIGGIDKYYGIKSAGWSKGITVSDNEIYGQAMLAAPTNTNQSSGIWIAASNDWQILNNDIYDNTNGIFFAFSTFDPGSGSHVITNNNIHANIRGINIDDGSEAVANNNGIYSNDSTAFSGIGFEPYGIINSGVTAFNATQNWWGSATGPTHASNVGGTGDTITDNVAYSPWWGANYVEVMHPWDWYTNTTSTIQDAIDASGNGDTINVADGTYNLTAQTEINKSVTLIGNNTHPTNVTVDAGDGTFSVFNVSANNVDISGFSCVDAGPVGNSGYSGIKLASGVTGCSVHANSLTGNQYGILIQDPEDTVIPGSNTFTNNTAENNDVSGIEMQHSNGNTFTGNISSSNGSYGFRLDGVSGNTFTGNISDSNTKTGFSLVKGSSAGGCINNTFTGNTANSNTEYGVREDYGDNNVWTGSTFDLNVLAGMRFKETITNLMVDHNDITNSPIGIDITFSTTQPDVTTWTVVNNVISGNSNFGVSNGGTGDLNAIDNDWGNASGPAHATNPGGTGNAVTDHILFRPWLPYHDVDASVDGGHGTISPATQNIGGGNDATINITPDANYHIASIMDNSVSVPIASPYQVTTVIAAHDVVVAFARDNPVINQISPEAGAPGTEVTITGTGFGSSRSGSYVTFDGVQATEYSLWSDTKIICKVPDSAGTGVVCVVVGNTSSQSDPVFDVVSPTWYLAEGSTAWGFETYITIENPNNSAVPCVVTYMPSNGLNKVSEITLPAESQYVLNPRESLGAVDFSTKVESKDGKTIAVDRRMFWTGPGAASPEGHASIGVTSPEKTWYLAEGSTKWGFETWLLIQNPNDKDATCDVTYMIEGEGPRTVKHVVKAKSRNTFNMEADIGQKDASIKVVSDVPVIPERAQYRNNRREGSDSIGTTSPATDFFLAEGTTAWGFQTWVLVQNPNDSETEITLTYMTSSGPLQQAPFKMPANSRRTINVNTEAPSMDLSTKVHATQPIIAERAMYWNHGSGEACHDSIGMSQPHTTFYLPDGETTNGYETWTLVQNPNNEEVEIEVNYLTPTGKGNKVFTDKISANSRKTYSLSSFIPSGRASSVVTCKTPGRKIMVERSMYWNNRGAGTDTIGGFSD